MAKPFIGIKRLWYGPELTAAQAGTLIDGASVKTLVTTQANGFTEIKNVHDGTWGYSQDDPSVTDYINELNKVAENLSTVEYPGFTMIPRIIRTFLRSTRPGWSAVTVPMQAAPSV